AVIDEPYLGRLRSHPAHNCSLPALRWDPGRGPVPRPASWPGRSREPSAPGRTARSVGYPGEVRQLRLLRTYVLFERIFGRAKRQGAVMRKGVHEEAAGDAAPFTHCGKLAAASRAANENALRAARRIRASGTPPPGRAPDQRSAR